MDFQMRSIMKSILNNSTFLLLWGLTVSDNHLTLKIRNGNLLIIEKQLYLKFKPNLDSKL